MRTIITRSVDPGATDRLFTFQGDAPRAIWKLAHSEVRKSYARTAYVGWHCNGRWRVSRIGWDGCTMQVTNL